jgi:hypothetical protein
MNDAQALTLAELAVGNYLPVRTEYRMLIRSAIADYFLTDGARITKYRNRFKKAIADYFDTAFRMGFADAGGDPENMEPSDQEWLAAAITGEWGYCEMLFDQMKQLKPEASQEELMQFAADRAEGYAKTLDGVYNQGKLRGLPGIMLTFSGDDGAESCSTCQRLKGKRHSARWWVKRGLTIFRGNRNFECGAWQCQHFYTDDQGRVFTI